MVIIIMFIFYYGYYNYVYLLLLCYHLIIWLIVINSIISINCFNFNLNLIKLPVHGGKPYSILWFLNLF